MSNNNTVEILTIRIELNQLEQKAIEVMQLFATSEIDFTAYNRIMGFNNERRSQLQKRLNILESPINSDGDCYNRTDITASFKANWQTLNNEQRQRFLHKFIKKIVIHCEVQANNYYRKVIIDEVEFHEH